MLNYYTECSLAVCSLAIVWVKKRSIGKGQGRFGIYSLVLNSCMYVFCLAQTKLPR